MLLTHILQILMQKCECFVLYHETKSNLVCQFLFDFPKVKVAFHDMMNSLIRHKHLLSCFYDELLVNQDLGDGVKVKFTI
jgi:hypothetical protein